MSKSGAHMADLEWLTRRNLARESYALEWYKRTGFMIKRSTRIGLERLNGRRSLFRFGGMGRSFEDHPVLWNHDGRPLLYTCEPYHVDEDEVRSECEKHSLAYMIRPRSESMHYPGSTWLIEIVRRADIGLLERGNDKG